MTDEELKKLHVITCALEQKITVSEATNALGLSERRVKQLKKEVKENGAESIIHGNRGRKPVHSIDDKLTQKIIELKNSYKYQEANFCTFKNYLRNMKILRFHTLLFMTFSIMQILKAPKNIAKLRNTIEEKEKQPLV